MSYERFIEQVCSHGGLSSREDAERASEATLVVIGRAIPDRDAREIADHLPRPLARILDALEYREDLSPEAVFEEVAERQGIELGFAKEEVEVVCHALAGLLPPSTRLRFPPHLASLFTPFASEPALPRDVEAHHGSEGQSTQTTLAEGKPGSSHPLSDARPSHAQLDSVAREADPHAGRKLSSGRPGSRRPLSEARPTSARPFASDDEER